MAYKSGFFDAMDTGGGSYDRVYRAEDFAHYFSLFVRNGVFVNPATNLQVVANGSGMSVSILPGNGWINGYYVTVEKESQETLSVPVANSTLSRIDSVIAGLNFSERRISLYIKSSAVASKPSAIALQRDEDVYEIELAQIYVAAGASEISQANITDSRFNEDRCGIVKGLVEEIDTKDLFAQYDTAFHTWFDDLQIVLAGDVAANLQLQITQLEETIQQQKTEFDAEILHLENLAKDLTTTTIEVLYKGRTTSGSIIELPKTLNNYKALVFRCQGFGVAVKFYNSASETSYEWVDNSGNNYGKFLALISDNGVITSKSGYMEFDVVMVDPATIDSLIVTLRETYNVTVYGVKTKETS